MIFFYAGILFVIQLTVNEGIHLCWNKKKLKYIFMVSKQLKSFRVHCCFTMFQDVE